ncbi:molybdate ABC transporter substrate-binding protein [Candidatus Nitrospira bockiana]
MNMSARLVMACLFQALSLMLALIVPARVVAGEPLIIAASPSLKEPLEVLGRAYENKHPGVDVKLYFDSGLDLRRMIAGMENTGKSFIGSGPIHLIAPGGDELLDRMEQKYYVLPGTRRAYLSVPLVLVVPESLVDAPASFDAVIDDKAKRIAVADPYRTQLGLATRQFFEALGVQEAIKERLDVATDTRGVLDHLLSGQADVAIVFGSEAVKEQQRVRIAAVMPQKGYRPVIHSMAMERYCPNRRLCEDFLSFIQTSDAQAALKRLGFISPAEGR